MSPRRGSAIRRHPDRDVPRPASGRPRRRSRRPHAPGAVAMARTRRADDDRGWRGPETSAAPIGWLATSQGFYHQVAGGRPHRDGGKWSCAGPAEAASGGIFVVGSRRGPRRARHSSYVAIIMLDRGGTSPPEHRAVRPGSPVARQPRDAAKLRKVVVRHQAGGGRPGRRTHAPAPRSRGRTAAALAPAEIFSRSVSLSLVFLA